MVPTCAVVFQQRGNVSNTSGRWDRGEVLLGMCGVSVQTDSMLQVSNVSRTEVLPEFVKMKQELGLSLCVGPMVRWWFVQGGSDR